MFNNNADFLGLLPSRDPNVIFQLVIGVTNFRRDQHDIIYGAHILDITYDDTCNTSFDEILRHFNILFGYKLDFNLDDESETNDVFSTIDKRSMTFSKFIKTAYKLSSLAKDLFTEFRISAKGLEESGPMVFTNMDLDSSGVEALDDVAIKLMKYTNVDTRYGFNPDEALLPVEQYI